MEGLSKLRYGSCVKTNQTSVTRFLFNLTRIRLHRTVAAALAVVLLAPLVSVGNLSFINQANAAVGTVTCSGGGSFSVNAEITQYQGGDCIGIATIPTGVTSIGGNAFQKTSPSSSNRGGVTGIVFPASGLVSIGASAFQYTNLASINIPSSVTSVASQAFAGNPSLTSVSIAGSSNVGTPFSSGYYLFNEDPQLTSITLGSGAMNLNWLMFAGASITTVIGGSGILAVGDQSFSGVPLANFTFGKSIGSLGIESFRNTKLVTAALPCGLTSIGTKAFELVSTMTSVQMCADTSTVTSNFTMGAGAFSSNTNLKVFSFGKTLASTVKVTTWNDDTTTTRTWAGDTSLKWIQYCGSGSAFSAMTAHLVEPYIPAGVTVSCTPPKSVFGSLLVGSTGNTYSASGVTNNFLSLTLPSGKEISDNSAYTVEAWIKIDAGTNTGTNNPYGSIALGDTEYGITDRWNERTPAPSSYGSYYLNIGGSLQGRCDLNPGDYSEQNGLCPNVILPRGQWTHIAMQKSTPSGSTSRLNIFINGRIAVNRTVTNNSASLKYIMIGGFGDNNSGKVNFGQIRVTSGAIYPTDGVTTFSPQTTAFSKSVVGGTVVSLFQPIFNSTVENLFDYTGNGTLIKSYVSASNVVVSSDIPQDPIVTTRNVTITAPVTGATPQTTIADNGQFSTSITWSGSPSTFASNNAYTATVTVTPSGSYTLTGVSANFFTVNGNAATSGNLANAGTFTYLFPSTAKNTITTKNVTVTAPVLGATPQTSISDNGQFSAAISWTGSPTTFAANTVYTATITLTPSAAYSLTGVAANFFTVNGNVPTSGNEINSGTFTFTFPGFWQVSYLPNGGTGTQSSQYYQTGGSPVVLPSTSTLTAPTGKIFGGWATSATSTTAVTTDYQTAAAISYYAIWTQTSHTVTFDINGGDGAQTMANQSVAAPSSLTPNAYTYTGRYFLNWNTSSDGTGTQYADQAVYQFLANVRLYAQWGRVITYGSSGADSGLPSRTSDNWTSGAITLPTKGTMVKAGYDFAGWSNGINSYTETFTPTTIFTLSPVWIAHTYTVTFSKTGAATGSLPSSQTWTTGTSALTLSGNIGTPALALTGYTFGGWATAGAPNTLVTTYSSFSDQNFIPIWTPVSYSVTYNLNGGDGSTPTQSALNINQSFNLATPTRSNYAFLGWLLDGTSNKYSAGYSFTIGATTSTTLSFTAQWIAQYTVSYAMNGSTTVESDVSNVGLFVEGTILTLPSAPNLITGYNFGGWRDSNNILHAASDSFTVIQNSVLSVQWTAISYTVTYSLGIVSGTPPASSSATFNSTFSIPAAPSKPGYIFSNWNTSSDGTGTSYAGGQAYSVTSTGNITLTAQWAQIPYTVTYDLGGGTGTIPAALTNKHVGDSWTLPSSGSSPTWKAHTFLNWSDGSNSYAAGATYTLGAGSVTLTAMYQLNGTTSITYSFGSNPGSGILPTQAAQMEGTVISLKSGSGLSRDGYTFGGWTDGSSAYKAGDTFVVPVYSNAVTFSPIWNSGYTVTYSAGVGSGTVPTDSAVRYNGDTFVVKTPATPLVKDSFTFTGWSDGVNTYQSGSTYTVGNSSISLTAQWVQSSIYAARGSPMTELDHKTIRSGVGYPNQSFTVGSSTISYNIPADAFGLATDNLDMYIYALSDASSFSSILPTNETYILPTIITWLAADGTVPVASSPITQTITSSQIKVGTIAYALTGTTYSILGTSTQDGVMSISITADPVVVLGNPIVQPPANPSPSSQSSGGSISYSDSQALASAKLKAEADAKAAAELQAAQEKAKADAAELQIAREKADAAAKAANDAALLAKADADAKAVAEAKALADAELAAKLAAQKIVPDVTLYSLSPKLTLNAFDLAYLKKYVSTLKKTATVTCIGYTYTQKLSLTKATVLAKQQANAVCSVIKKTRPTLKTVILIRPSKSAPAAAKGAKWVAVSYRVDGYQIRK